MSSKRFGLRPSVSLAVVLACASVTFSFDARSQTAPAPAPGGAAAAKPGDVKKPAPPIDVKPIVAKLKSGDDAQIGAGLDDARMAGPTAAAAAPAIAELLGKGLSLTLTQSAVDTLGDREAEAGSPILAQYAAHRNAKVRRSAVKALTRTKGAPAVAALKHALADGDAVVRGTAASGLGTLKAKDAVGELFVALDHRVNEAAASIGQLCSPEQCEQLAGKLGKVPFDVITSGLDPVLFRPAAEVNDDAKVKLVGRIRELGTMEGNKFLRDVQKRWPEGWSKRVRQAIDQAVLATSGGAK